MCTLTAGAHRGDRTPDPRIKNPLLFLLSYMSILIFVAHPCCALRPAYRSGRHLGADGPFLYISFQEGVVPYAGAADGNRTRVTSLEGWCSTIELQRRGGAQGDATSPQDFPSFRAAKKKEKRRDFGRKVGFPAWSRQADSNRRPADHHWSVALPFELWRHFVGAGEGVGSSFSGPHRYAACIVAILSPLWRIYRKPVVCHTTSLRCTLGVTSTGGYCGSKPQGRRRCTLL